ncbi:MAG: LLM class F420-dependent oxidoreductase [Candidatus Bathyarchaeia archaeon]
MKFGACIPHYGVPMSKKAIADFCKLAERLNFDSIWTTDHIAVNKQYVDPYGSIFESLMTLSFAAAHTEHVKLGTSIIVLPLRNPIIFAKQTATLDQLSDGRLILGLGAGWMDDEFATLGFNFRDRGKIMSEQIRILRILWTEDQPEFNGHFFKFSDIVFLPKPVQETGLQLWIGGSSLSAFKRVARLGDGWHPVGLSPKEFAQGKEKLNSILKSGRKITMSVRVPVKISSSAKTTYTMSSGDQAYMVGGGREAVVREIEAYEHAGLDHLVCYFGNEPYEQVTAQTTLFAEEIMPSFKR